MSSAVGSATNVTYTPPTPVVKTKVKDSDGDYDGSKAGEVEKTKANTAKPISGPVGTQVDTYA
jgi:hypothetical protein